MTVADELAAAILPWWTQEYEDYMRAWGGMFAQVEQYADDQVDADGNLVVPGWYVMLDVDTAPLPGLPFLAQWIGERLPSGITEGRAREWIRDAPNQRRGTVQSIARAAQRSLIGSRIVQILERTFADGSPDPNGDNFVVYTYEADTPDPGQVQRDIATVCPADMEFHYQALVGATWAGLQVGGVTWAQLQAQYTRWEDFQGAQPGASVWPR